MSGQLASRLYLVLVFALGGTAIAMAAHGLFVSPPEVDFYYLAGLTVVSGFLPVKLPGVSANISVSETFVYAGTMLLGTRVGVLLVVLDALVIWLKIWWTTRREEMKWKRMFFSITASPLSIAVASTIMFWLIRRPPLSAVPADHRPDIWWYAFGLIVFAGVYFIWNSALVAVAIGLEQRASAFQIWRRNFSGLWLNYLAGASIASLLIYNTTRVTPAFLFVIVPVVLLMFSVYRALRESTVRIEEAERHLREMNRTFLQTIEAFAIAVDAKDQVTHGHIRRVQRHTMALAERLGIKDPRMLDALRAAALLHDTGKLAVPEYILNKPGRLTPAEFEKMKLHASIGADILKTIDFPYPIEPIVRHHHESWDGTGYPAGLKGTDIPIGARILSVVDCYDAVRSTRPYRTGMTREESARVLRDRRGVMYDPEIVDTFLGMVDELEALDSVEERPPITTSTTSAAQPLEAIKAAVREQRDYEAARLPAGNAASPMAPVLLAHFRRVAPVETVALFHLKPGTHDLVVSNAAGLHATDLTRLQMAVGEGIAGWVYAHKQPALNSEAALDLGGIFTTLPDDLKYAMVLPFDGSDGLVAIGIYGPERFQESHRQLFEFAIGLAAVGLAAPPVATS